MCEATWMFASFQSTSVPFIQILPVPGKAISGAPSLDPNTGVGKQRMSGRHPKAWSRKPRAWLLRFATERALGGAGGERLAAVPAEAGLRRFAGAQARLDVGGLFLGDRDDRACPCRLARRGLSSAEHRIEQ